ncbi:MAG: radical SAM protein, partial [Candidatus Latescibacteria bacterium]|nr:radical SAM protein [Candidatus Latescibacterota bacterium]
MISEINEIAEPKAAVDLIARDFPNHIDIDLSNKCNLRCRFCHLSFHEPEKWQQISYDQFLKIAPALEKVETVSLFSKYEPLTCRDFIPIFDKICEYDAETYFSTNGILLKDDIIDALVGRLTYLTVSVTGFTRESYKKNMGQDRLETVRENLTKLNEAKKAAN